MEISFQIFNKKVEVVSESKVCIFYNILLKKIWRKKINFIMIFFFFWENIWRRKKNVKVWFQRWDQQRTFDTPPAVAISRSDLCLSIHNINHIRFKAILWVWMCQDDQKATYLTQYLRLEHYGFFKFEYFRVFQDIPDLNILSLQIPIFHIIPYYSRFEYSAFSRFQYFIIFHNIPDLNILPFPDS